MRLLASFTLLFCLAGTAFAQSSSTNQVKSEMTYQDARQKLKGFSLFGYYNFANRSPLKIGQETFDAKNNETLGFGVQYRYSISRHLKDKTPLSVVAGLGYETTRELEAVTENGNQGMINGAAKPGFSMLLLTGNMDYRFTDQASVFGGLNFPVPFESNFGEVQLDGTIGFQTGLSLAMTPAFGADISYRWINITGNNGLNRIDVDGLMVKGRYIF